MLVLREFFKRITGGGVKDQTNDEEIPVAIVEKAKNSETLTVPIAGVSVFTRMAREFRALGIAVSVEIDTDEHSVRPKRMRAGKLTITCEDEVGRKQFMLAAQAVLDANVKAQGDMSATWYRHKLHLFAHQSVHKVAEHLAEQREISVAEIYKEKINAEGYLPSIDDLRKAFVTKEEFDKWSAKHLLYEVFTQEYILELGSYLVSRFEELGRGKSSLTVVEVGAGNGMLTRELQREVSELYTFQDFGQKKVQFIATDDASWVDVNNRRLVNIGENVEEIGYQDAITKYKPDLVISSWLPPNTDWTAYFREMKVEEYILIGRSGEGVSGTLEDTWDIRGPTDYFYDPKQDYARHNISGKNQWIGAQQVSKQDEPPFTAEPFTSTVSFRRQ